MELDELKLHLKQRLDADQPAKTQEEITALLAKKTSSVLGKIKKSLVFEIVCCVLFIVVCIAVITMAGYRSMKIYFSIFTVLLFPFLFVLIYLYKKMKAAGEYSMPVKNNLENLYALLKEFVKRYFQFTMGLIPVCLIVAMWLGYNEPAKDIQADATSNSSLMIFLALYVVVLATGMYFFTKWYLKKLYGNYIDQLKGLIQELGE